MLVGGSGSELRKGRNSQRVHSKATDPSGHLKLTLAGELANQAAPVSALPVFGRESRERGSRNSPEPLTQGGSGTRRSLAHSFCHWGG